MRAIRLLVFLLFFGLHYTHCLTMDWPLTEVKDFVSSFLLKSTTFKHPAILDSYRYFHILGETVIPATETTYWCSIHKLPEHINQPIHIVGYDADIESKHLVHHMELFLCNKEDIQDFDGICKKDSSCEQVVATWASGASAVVYPDQVGMLLNSSKERQISLRLEIHYNNPGLVSKKVDKSGFKIWYTTKIRRFDAGIVEVGTIYTSLMGIPPKTTFQWDGFCPSKCTAKGFPKDGINVLFGQLHSHLVGRKMRISIYRNDSFLEDILRDEDYSTWNEKIYPLRKKILPGDVIVTSCLYDTIGRNLTTLGGLGIKDEMCVGYLHYFPATKLSVCKSSVSEDSIKALSRFFHKSPSSRSLRDLISKPEVSKILQKFYRQAPIDVHCLDKKGTSLEGKWKNLKDPFQT